MMENLIRRVSELERRLENIVQIGRIQAVDYAAARCRVTIGEIKTGWLAWTTMRAMGDVSWAAPEVGEQVLVVSPSADPAQAIVCGALYQNTAPAPAAGKTLNRTLFADGAVIEYDRAASIYSITIPDAGAFRLNVGASTLAITASGWTVTTPDAVWIMG